VCFSWIYGASNAFQHGRFSLVCRYFLRVERPGFAGIISEVRGEVETAEWLPSGMCSEMSETVRMV